MAPGDLRGVVALDGPSGTGKSTVARRLARQLGASYLDTGAMYRAVTLAVLRAGVDPTDAPSVISITEAIDLSVGTDPAHPSVHIGGADVAKEIRAKPVTLAVSAVSAIPRVRAMLVARQQATIERELARVGGIVVEGRDIGTVVAPQAPVKLFLTASAAARAGRRNAEVAGATGTDLDRTRADLERRDRLDSGRAVAPLLRAPDAIEVDTTDLDQEQVVAAVLAVVRRSMAQPVGGAVPRTT